MNDIVEELKKELGVEDVVSIQQFAELSGTSYSSVAKAIDDGRIKAVLNVVNNQRYIAKSELSKLFVEAK